MKQPVSGDEYWRIIHFWAELRVVKVIEAEGTVLVARGCGELMDGYDVSLTQDGYLLERCCTKKKKGHSLINTVFISTLTAGGMVAGQLLSNTILCFLSPSFFI